MIKSSKALTDFVIVSEDLRKKFSDNLRVALSEKDNDKNTIFDLQQNKKLCRIQYQLVESKLEMIFESVDAISNAKCLEDGYKNTIRNLEEKVKKLEIENKEQESDFVKECKTRDRFRDELKVIADFKEKTDRQNAFYVTQSRENINNLN